MKRALRSAFLNVCIALGAAVWLPRVMASEAVPLISSGSTWKYWDATNDPGDSWRTLGFDPAGGQTTVSITSSGNYRQLGYVYLSPIPGAGYNPAQTRYILARFNDVAPTAITNLSSFITVTGASSGNHAGQTRIASDGRTVMFTMTTDFTANELVTVTLVPIVSSGATGTVEPYQYQFMISGPMPGSLPQPPIVAITSPPDNSFFPVPAVFTLQAAASDPNGTVTLVEFFQGSTKLGEVATAPYSLAWSNALTGNYSFRAVATDNDALRSTSSWVYVTLTPPGSNSGGLAFDGVNDYVTFGQAAGLGTRTFTLEAWVYWTGRGVPVSTGSGGVNALPVIAKLVGEGDGGVQDGNYLLGIDPATQRMAADFEEGSTGTSPGLNHRVYGVTPITANFWHHLAATYDGTNWQLYLDGSLETTLFVGQPPRWDSVQHAALGSTLNSQGAPAGYFSGILDEMRIWNYARTGPELASNRFVEVVSAPGLLGRWGLNETNGIVAQDSSGNGNHGTLMNGPVWTGGYFTNAPPDPQPPPVGAVPLALAGVVQPNGVSIPSDFPTPVITVNNNPSPGYIFLENVGRSGSYYTMILDNNGSPVWYRRGGGREFKVQKNGMITWSTFTGVDKNFNFARYYSTVNGYSADDHELEVLPNGGYLMIGYHDQGGIDLTRYLPGASASATVHGTTLQEFTAAGELILQFRAWDHFDIRDVEPVVENPLAANVRFSHMNAIDVDTDGHLLLSSRHLSEVTKIHRDTGQILWRLSGAHSDFTFVNDPLNGFRNQHDISALGNNHYMVFDNGNGHSPQVSRAVEYQLDLTHMTATLVWQFRNNPDRYTYYMGNAQRLTNGNTLINFVLSGYPKVTEVDSNGVKHFEMNLSPGSDLYRAFRFPWDGVVAAPYLITEAYPDNVTLIFNKFGDRTVDYYRIYGGTAPNPTTLLATSKTTLKHLNNVVNGVRNYFRVTAVSTNGVESAYSNEENLVVNIIKPGESMVLNGAFSAGTNSWTRSVGGTATAGWIITNGVSFIDVTNAGTQLSDIQLRQAGMKLLQGREYVLEFDAWAPLTRSIEARVGQNQSPFASYKIASRALTPVQQHFTYPFVMTNATDLNARLTFNFGASTRDVYLDNVSLWMVALGDMNQDRCVNYADLAIFNSQWLRRGTGLSADLNGDGRVDFMDFVILGENWSGDNCP